LVDQKQTITVFKPIGSLEGSWNGELPLLEWLEERTNVHVQADEVMSEAFEEQFNLLLATGPLPDFFL
jgi:putative aldouronate transport system substrate-binding protein